MHHSNDDNQEQKTSAADIPATTDAFKSSTITSHSDSHSNNSRSSFSTPAEDAILATPIYSGPGSNLRPFVSPDCRWIAFSNDQSGHFEIYVIGIRLVCLSRAANVFAIQVTQTARRITYLAAFSTCIGWNSKKRFHKPSSSSHTDAAVKEIKFVSDAKSSNVEEETVWYVNASGGAPRCSMIGQADFHCFCRPLRLHIIGRYTRESHKIPSMWKVRQTLFFCSRLKVPFLLARVDAAVQLH